MFSCDTQRWKRFGSLRSVTAEAMTYLLYVTPAELFILQAPKN